MQTVDQRIEKLRKLMEEKGIDIYYIPNEDDHLSEEYTADYFKCKSFISGFSGEAGCTIVTKDFAGLWTDGRYFTQAEHELEGTCVTLMRLRQEGVVDPIPFLIDNTPENGCLGFDGKVVSSSDAIHLSKELEKKNAKLHTTDDLVDTVWGKDRPSMPQEEIYILPKKYVGEDITERIQKVRDAMKEKGADVLVLTKLEDPCWMLNIRGNDIESTPVSYAFAVVTENEVIYYVDKAKVTDEVEKYFAEAKVTLKGYNDIEKDLEDLKDKKIWVNLRSFNTSFYSHLDSSNQIINEDSPVVLFRAIKNETELTNTINAHIKDGVAMVRFLYWLKHNIQTVPMTERSAEDKLLSFREEQEGFIEPSFHTISAYKGNAAMMHYTANDETNAELHPEGFLLVDSGGTYFDGTTDITRTIALGKLSDEEKMYFTKVLKANLQLGRAKFLHGTTGVNLDILARGVLWDIDIDYQCGTGHGVGHVLGVHEGPHGIRWGSPLPGRSAAVLEEGMIVTNEPGVYIPHVVGVRIENELVVRKDVKNFYGQFLHFENITVCPIDIDAIDPQYLDDRDLEDINSYHKHVYETLSPYLVKEEAEWLKSVTKEIKR